MTPRKKVECDDFDRIMDVVSDVMCKDESMDGVINYQRKGPFALLTGTVDGQAYYLDLVPVKEDRNGNAKRNRTR